MIVRSGTTSTGQSNLLSGGPFTRVAVEVEGGPGTVVVEGRVGSTWSALIASSTFDTGGYSATVSSTAFLVTSIRANVSAWGSTADQVIHLVGA